MLDPESTCFVFTGSQSRGAQRLLRHYVVISHSEFFPSAKRTSVRRRRHIRDPLFRPQFKAAFSAVCAVLNECVSNFGFVRGLCVGIKVNGLLESFYLHSSYISLIVDKYGVDGLQVATLSLS